MNWIKYNNFSTLMEGTICRTSDGEFVIAGEINTSKGTNDEFTEEITHFTDDKVELIKQLLNFAKKDFELQNIT